MNSLEKSIKKYENKIKESRTMTDLLVAMSAWQTFADSHGLSEQQREDVEKAYIQAESTLISQVKPMPW